MMSEYRGHGVYVFRTRRPGMLGRMPQGVPLGLAGGFGAAYLIWGYGWTIAVVLASFLLQPRHFAYVGESNAVRLRKRAHLEGGGKYHAVPKPWADLDPTWYCLALPWAPKWLLRAVETAGIVLLWPVYNKQKNLWNPRRIPLESAKKQRVQRDAVRWSFNFRVGHLILWIAAGCTLLMRGWFV